MKVVVFDFDETLGHFGQLGDFKKGGFILAIKSGLPVIPLTIIYNKRLIRVVVDDGIDSLNYNQKKSCY